MLEFNINWIAVIISAIANMIVGAVWYGVFATPWLEGIGKTREWANENQRALDYIIALINSFLMAFFLANVIAWAGVSGIGNGIAMGLFMWLGFTGFTFAANHAFESRPLKLWAVNAGTYLAGLMVMGAILGIWQ